MYIRPEKSPSTLNNCHNIIAVKILSLVLQDITFTLFVLNFARTDFALSPKKIHLRAKISTEFTLKKAMREI